jgi:hypothetical protein
MQHSAMPDAIEGGSYRNHLSAFSAVCLRFLLAFESLGFLIISLLKKSIMTQAFDSCLRCNTLRCRIPLPLVCPLLPVWLVAPQELAYHYRHIFCLECAKDVDLSLPVAQDRHCPACHVSLPNADDAVSVVSSPTEAYKASVLDVYISRLPT